ncbi:MAG TPA: hypothetical protein VJK49_04590, partial [Candidatus Limnocylindrales bacterium]|nr:hypothetical protein [Candidatus Limnocylindrales bacterium]
MVDARGLEQNVSEGRRHLRSALGVAARFVPAQCGAEVFLRTVELADRKCRLSRLPPGFGAIGVIKGHRQGLLEIGERLLMRVQPGRSIGRRAD